MRKYLLVLTVLLAQIALAGAILTASASPSNMNQTDNAGDQPATILGDRAIIALSAGIAVGLACLAAGIAISASGSAAISAAAEKPETFFRSFLVVALAEALAIYGLIVGILLWLKV